MDTSRSPDDVYARYIPKAINRQLDAPAYIVLIAIVYKLLEMIPIEVHPNPWKFVSLVLWAGGPL